MVNHELIEGIRIALSRGYTLEQAMMSFYNAGYPKQEIEEAARVLMYHPSQPLSHPEKTIPEEMKRPVKVLPSAKPQIIERLAEKPVEKQKISTYEEKTEAKGKFVTVLLIVILFIILAMLAGIFIFKKELIDFFTNLFA